MWSYVKFNRSLSARDFWQLDVRSDKLPQRERSMTESTFTFLTAAVRRYSHVHKPPPSRLTEEETGNNYVTNLELCSAELSW